jgi:hypothetical protein
VRIGNRPNEGYAEMTVCFYEPDGSASFMWKKPEIEGNAAHHAGGLRFEVTEHWKQHHVTYRGGACVMKDPLDMADPSAAFRSNPHEKIDLDIRWLGLSPGWGGEPRRKRADGTYESAAKGGSGAQFARGHFEEHGAAKGTLRIGDREYTIDEQQVHDRLRVRLHPAGGGAPIDVTGRVLSLVPCRNRRAGWVTRISEGMTEWRIGDRVGYGMSEYLDHLKKGE